MRDEAGVDHVVFVGPEGGHLLTAAAVRSVTSILGTARTNEDRARACQAALGIQP